MVPNSVLGKIGLGQLGRWAQLSALKKGIVEAKKFGKGGLSLGRRQEEDLQLLPGVLISDV